MTRADGTPELPDHPELPHMRRLNRKKVIRIGLALLVVALLIYGFWPEAIPVQTASVTRGPLQVTIEVEGETQAEERFVVSAPVAAYVRRIDLEPGDGVTAGQTVAELEAPRAAILDPRSRAEAQARVDAARAGADRAQAAAALAVEERDRVRRLAAEEAATGQAREQAEAEAEQAVAARDAAVAELQAALAAVAGGGGDQGVRTVVTAPITGRVLTVHHKSAGTVNPGEPLLELGDTDRLEVAVDVLSQDAVRIHPGTRVLLSQWGGEPELEASVTRIAPQGFTDVSALGVEERRVEVVAGIVSPPALWSSLGAGYRVLARFVIWESDNVLQVPTSALFRADDGWAAFVIENDRAARRAITVGHRSGLHAEVLSGLAEGEEVIVHPGNEVEDGSRVRG